MAPRSIQYLRKESCYDFTEISGALKALENTTAVPGKEESGADVVVADDGASRYDMGEMSKALGAVEGTIKKRMKRRPKKLKKRLKKMTVITAEGRRRRRGPAIDFSDLDELWNWSLFSPGNPDLAQSWGPSTVFVPASSPRSNVQSSIQSAYLL